MIIRILISLALVLGFQGSAKAYQEDRGTYWCDCVVQDHNGGEQAASATLSAYSYFRSEILPKLKTEPGQLDTVTVCDGNYCVKFRLESSVWRTVGKRSPDPKKYNNAAAGFNGVSVAAGGGRGADYSYSLKGHWESIWVHDHTSGSVTFVESIFIVEAIVFTYSGPDPYQYAAN